MKGGRKLVNKCEGREWVSKCEERERVTMMGGRG